MPKKTEKTEKPRPRASGKTTAKMTERFAPKGRAVPNAEPAPPVPAAEVQTPAPVAAASEKAVAAPELGLTVETRPKKDDLPRGLENTTALTVRLDPERYRLVRYHTFDYDMTNQEFLVHAVDAYLAAHRALKARGLERERLSNEMLTEALEAYLRAKK